MLMKHLELKLLQSEQSYKWLNYLLIVNHCYGKHRGRMFDSGLRGATFYYSAIWSNVIMCMNCFCAVITSWMLPSKVEFLLKSTGLPGIECNALWEITSALIRNHILFIINHLNFLYLKNYGCRCYLWNMRYLLWAIFKLEKTEF